MIFYLIKVSLYVALSIIAFYFILANVSAMNLGDTKEINSDGAFNVISTSQVDSPINNDLIEKELEAYGRQLIDRNAIGSGEIKNHITQQVQFKQKHKQEKQTESKSGLLTGILKYATPVSKMMQTAPDLENYEDYAPTDTPLTNKKPILLANKRVPNYLDLEKDAYLSRSTPLPINEFDTHRPANFLSERTTPWFDKVTGDNLSFFFQKNPFKSFDEISKADVTDPLEWEKIARKKEASSPLLSMSCMQPESSGFMPSNHYDTGKKYSSLSGGFNT